jgi:hypothetical protein
VPATVAAELVGLAGGLAIYVAFRSRRHPARLGRLAGFVVVLLGLYLANLYGPAPPSVTAIAVADIIGLIGLALFAGWVDRRAEPGPAH